MADKATALETYEELVTGGITANVCVDRSVEGRCEGVQLAVTDKVTAPVSSYLILPRVVSSCLISSHLISSCLVLYCLVLSHLVSCHLVSSHLASSCLEGGLQWQTRPLPWKLMMNWGQVVSLLMFVWKGVS